MQMPGATKSEASCVQYYLEVRIAADVDTVWDAMLNETAHWWLEDFQMVGADSTVEFDLTPGGRGLVEHRDDGSFLQWYAVQSFLPVEKKIYLIGHMAPDFGGPSTSSLTLSLFETDTGCKLAMTDAHFGNVDQKTVDSLGSGWKQLFEQGLRDFVEKKTA